MEGLNNGATMAGMPSAEVEKVKVTVLAAGAFGIAMATLVARRKHDVFLYARDANVVQTINETHRSPRVFPQFNLLPNIRATTSVAEATSDAKIVIVCLPAQLTPDFLAQYRDDVPTDAVLVITCKGLYLKTKQLLAEPILEALQRDQPLAFLSGPSFALELMNNAPSAVVVAAKLLYHAVYVQRLLSTVDFRIYSSQDIVGVQLGGALKNPLAIGAGMVEGAGYKINTLAAYVTRSSLELQKLCLAMGGQPMTISGLSGIGDLMLTAFGSLSRNRTFGLRLIQGEKSEDLLRETTVEGVPTAEVAVYFAEQCGLDLPIFRTVNAMIKGHVKREQLQELLMNRPLKSET
ncbi:NAD-dependent glycerol-3-phosphate dehydrogenase C-terminus [Phytophthora infestans]|uniref:Glycerol-3-phosphate dehydrogenase [NAD(+)] n=2 Tax=Phytophthora infestans TaxID=4787 RepID=A0A8S9UF30_PHYIN|nr:NAD-dependent glycerol-3-phosphate dehydrogenase C-terminus [Phytophthora infestans]